jgi:hypothetical protein
MNPSKRSVLTVVLVAGLANCGAPGGADAGIGGGSAGGLTLVGGGSAGGGSAAGGSAGGAVAGGAAGGSSTAPKRAFVTSRTWAGNLRGSAASGVLGADAKCQTAAMTAGLSGTFKALVSTDTVDAIDRMADVGPWVQRQVGGADVVVLPSRAALGDQNASRTFLTDETGAALPASKAAWTGNLPNGRRDTGFTCRSWESSAATDSAETGASTGQGWQHDGPSSCDTALRLICLEQ